MAYSPDAEAFFQRVRAVCPSFVPVDDERAVDWQDDHGPLGYIRVAALALHLTDLAGQGHWDRIIAVLDEAQSAVTEGDGYTRDVIIVGLLETFQNFCLQSPDAAIAAFGQALNVDSNDQDALTGYHQAPERPGGPATSETHGLREGARKRVAGRPAVRVSTRRVFLVLAPYLALITVAETAVTFINPMLVFPLHGGMIAVLAAHLAVLGQRAGRDPADRYLAALLLTLMLPPLIRVISLTLPPQLPDPYQYLFAGIAMMVGAFMVARYIGFRPRWIGLEWRGTSWQLLAIIGSVMIGLVEYLILRPEPLGAFPWTVAGWLPAVSVAFATGFPEELIFRGMMQTAARPVIGTGWNVLYVSLVFTVLHTGYQSGLDLVFVFGASLFYGWIFEQSRSIIGVSIGHGLANAILFFVAPNLF